jgi:hypothetical protein
VKRGSRFPENQAEVLFSDISVEQLAELNIDQRYDVLSDVVRLCDSPSGKHPLSRSLRGWNTLEVLDGHKRVIYRATIQNPVGLIEVLCLGPRSDQEVYDLALALIKTGLLTDEEGTQLWDALALLEVVAESVGLDGWDFRAPPAPDGLVKTVVAAGVLEEAIAKLLSQDEILAAMNASWSETGRPNMEEALEAALKRARFSSSYPAREILFARSEPRCALLMPRAKIRCIRKFGHPGPHRAKA